MLPDRMETRLVCASQDVRRPQLAGHGWRGKRDDLVVLEPVRRHVADVLTAAESSGNMGPLERARPRHGAIAPNSPREHRLVECWLRSRVNANKAQRARCRQCAAYGSMLWMQQRGRTPSRASSRPTPDLQRNQLPCAPSFRTTAFFRTFFSWGKKPYLQSGHRHVAHEMSNWPHYTRA